MITFKGDLNPMLANIANLEKIPNQVLKDAYSYFVSTTPVRSGRARRSTERRGDSIVAAYPYAQRLDEGWSRQAPDGMTKPTQEYIDRRINELVKGKGA